MMTRKEINEIAEKYGYFEMSEDLMDDELVCIHFIPRDSLEPNKIGYVLDIYPNKDFEFRYSTTAGCLQLSSGKASPVTLENHFKSHERIFKEFVTVLWKYEEDRGKSWRIKQK